jgi:hypothetical protein
MGSPRSSLTKARLPAPASGRLTATGLGPWERPTPFREVPALPRVSVDRPRPILVDRETPRAALSPAAWRGRLAEALTRPWPLRAVSCGVLRGRRS